MIHSTFLRLFGYAVQVVSPELRRAFAGYDSPLGILDLDALDRNAAALVARAGGLPIRVASKSLRVPKVLRRVLDTPGYQGILAFSLPEAVGLFELGFTDIVVAYPTTHRGAIAQLADNKKARETITLMVDSTDHLDYLAQYSNNAPLRVCLDVDASLRIAEAQLHDSLHIGSRRSPVRTPQHAVGLVAQIQRTPMRLVGIMSYEGQIAGLGNVGNGPKARMIRVLQAASAKELATRRAAVIDAVSALTDVEFVNGGGTGSLEVSSAEGTLTELAAGSGLLSPGLFDGYQHFRHEPAAYFASPVVRIPGPGWVTVFQGGWIASGPVGPDRLPTVAWPPDLRYNPTEGAGEVQTPLTGPGAEHLRVGDMVYFRHAKSGELAEHLNEFHVYSHGEVIDTWETYRGMGWAL